MGLDQVSQLIQYFFSGLTLGSVYALIAVSLVVVYQVSRVICFAQGEFFVIGALAMVTLTTNGLPLFLAFPISVFVSSLIGALLQQVLIRPIQNSSVGSLIVMTIAISLFLRGAALLVWGRSSHILAPFSTGRALQVFGASLQLQVIWIVAITGLVLIVMWIFFEKTALGLAMRACAENSLGARLVGISVEKSVAFAWAWGAAIGALAGIVVAPLLFMQYSSGIMPMIKGFIAMSIGGLSSIVGAVVAGLLLGILEAYTIGIISSKFSDTIVFGTLLLVLVIKPQGLFSKR
jgi:branched-chain amino acid transport system permease protein